MKTLSLKLFTLLVLAGSTAFAQEPADTLKDVRPFGTHVLEMIQEAGVEVVSSPGAPGMTPDIFIHGMPIRPGMPPLYIVDGFRVRSLDGIAPEAIESIQVLKDASAMGVWGAEAAPGVVVVTTRRASQKGFHAGYSFTGGFQSLSHEPAPMSLEEWRSYGHFTSEEYVAREQITPETAFLHNHHLYAQYGGSKWNAHAGFSMLDNNGPYPGRKDSHRRYAASWSASYQPLKWLSMETTGQWSNHQVQEAPDSWLWNHLIAVPLYKPNNKYYKDWSRSSYLLVQGKMVFAPLPGLYVRGLGQYSREVLHTYHSVWEDDYRDRVTADDNWTSPSGYQWGIDADWTGRWKGHRVHVDARFRRVKEEIKNRRIKVTGYPEDFGVSLGDDDHLVTEYLDKAFDAYVSARNNNSEDFMFGVLIPYGIQSIAYAPETLKYKETGLSAGYDWNDRYSAGYSFHQIWEDKPFHEGFQVHAVTLGWNPLKEPLLRRSLPAWWKDWTFKASWATVDKYLTLYNEDLWTSQYYLISPLFTSARRRDITTSARFQAGKTSVDVTASWYVNADHLHSIGSSFGAEPKEIVEYSFVNRGLDLSVGAQGMIGQVRYSVSSGLSLYGNRVFTGVLYSKLWNTDVPYFIYNSTYPSYGMDLPYAAVLHDGGRMGEGYYYTVQEDGSLCSYEDRQLMGPANPTVTGFLRLSVGWKRWQLTVSGHGRGGQIIRDKSTYSLLNRYYQENLRTDANPNGKYQKLHFDGVSLPNTEYAFHDGSFFRIDQMRLDYTLPVHKVRVNLFASMENAFLFTKYPGSDPELALTIKGFGKEAAAYPSTRRTIFGVSVDF